MAISLLELRLRTKMKNNLAYWFMLLGIFFPSLSEPTAFCVVINTKSLFIPLLGSMGKEDIIDLKRTGEIRVNTS